VHSNVCRASVSLVLMRNQGPYYDMYFDDNRCDWLHCGRCRYRRPFVAPVRVAKATRRRPVNVIDGFDLLIGLTMEDEGDDFLDEPHYPNASQYAAKVVTVKLARSRVFQIVRDAKRVHWDEIRADLVRRRGDLTSEEIEEEVRQLMGTERSSLSNGRFGLEEVIDDVAGRCVVTCYRCKMEYVIDREKSATAIADIKNRGGIAYLTAHGIKVTDKERE
jgi:hypothetical protein